MRNSNSALAIKIERGKRSRFRNEWQDVGLRLVRGLRGSAAMSTSTFTFTSRHRADIVAIIIFVVIIIVGRQALKLSRGKWKNLPFVGRKSAVREH